MAADRLTRFLLTEAHTRGAIIKAENIAAAVAEVHGLAGPPQLLLTQGLVAAILMLSLSKGGIRQVLQFDGEGGAIARMLTEAREGTVRGFLNWRQGHATMAPDRNAPPLAWLGRNVVLAAVRDLGFGHPYVSATTCESPYIADHLMQYMHQSVQIRADVLILDKIGLVIEAMPDCDEKRWFSAIERMAALDKETLSRPPRDILEAFAPLGLKILEDKDFAYRCDCKPEVLARSLVKLPESELTELRDAQGYITVSCDYCGKTYRIKHTG